MATITVRRHHNPLVTSYFTDFEVNTTSKPQRFYLKADGTVSYSGIARLTDPKMSEVTDTTRRLVETIFRIDGVDDGEQDRNTTGTVSVNRDEVRVVRTNTSTDTSVENSVIDALVKVCDLNRNNLTVIVDDKERSAEHASVRRSSSSFRSGIRI